MGIDSGLWETLDGGDIWTRHNRGLPNRPVTMLYLPYEQYEILVATYGCGVYRVEAIKVDTGFASRVSRGSEAIPADAFMLHASYPNPFTDETLLAFSTPALANIRLDVFDVLGRRVPTVTDQAYYAGDH